jgi:hypothetical protein
MLPFVCWPRDITGRRRLFLTSARASSNLAAS